MTIDYEERNLRQKCKNCSSFVEVAGGPDHGDFRCTNKESQAYDRRINELEKKELHLVENCRVREGVRTAIVTGASRGIGKAIVKELAGNRKGYDIALISRHYNELEKVIQEIASGIYYEHHGFCFVPFECDVGNLEQARKTFEEIYREFGSIDILVNNAGENSRTTLKKPDNLEKDLAGFQQEVSTNLLGTYIFSSLAAGYMIKQNRGGSIINISSIKARDPTSGCYGASKAGVEKLTVDLANAWAQYGIRVNCVAPGFIDTGMTAELPDDRKAAYMAQIPMKRFGNVKEVAKVVAFLASDDASYITGAVIPVNGGLRMG